MYSVLFKVKGLFNRMNLSISFLAILTMLLGNPVFSEQHCCANYNLGDDTYVNQKVYVNYSDLNIDEDGIILMGSKGVSLVDLLGSDEQGFYIYARDREQIRPREAPKCMNGHPIYHAECGGCAHWWCPFRCKCSSPIMHN